MRYVLAQNWRVEVGPPPGAQERMFPAAGTASGHRRESPGHAWGTWILPPRLGSDGSGFPQALADLEYRILNQWGFSLSTWLSVAVMVFLLCSGLCFHGCSPPPISSHSRGLHGAASLLSTPHTRLQPAPCSRSQPLNPREHHSGNLGWPDLIF